MLSSTAHELLMAFLKHHDSVDLRVHGNGFIQIDLDHRHRLHVWDHRLPRQKVSTQIHDHRFSFHSTCLVGELFQIEYDVELGDDYGNYQVYVPVTNEGEDTRLIRLGQPCQVELRTLYSVSVGNSYDFDALRFHETSYDHLTVTLMEKTKETDHQASVLIKVGEEPDNDFNRYGHQSHLGVLKVYREAVHQIQSQVRDGII